MFLAKGALLLSRQPHRFCQTTPWVRQLVNTIDFAKQNKLTLLSSVGLLNWEVITTLASLNRIPLILLLPDKHQIHTKEWAADQFHLDRQLTTFITLPSKTNNWLQQRDEEIIKQASFLIPISLRPGGTLDTFMRNSATPKINSFQTPYSSKTDTQAYTITADNLNPCLAEIADNYLIHWTRSPNAPWPNQTLYDYYLSLINSPTYPQTALATLERIISAKTIIASANHMPGNHATVAFSGNTPRQMLPLFRWRSRYRTMSFEPYGIGITKSSALRHGITKVTYYQLEEKPRIPENNSWRYQSSGKISDWTKEQEYRHPGNLDFSNTIFLLALKVSVDILYKYIPLPKSEASQTIAVFPAGASPVSSYTFRPSIENTSK